jgi:hypothetical protein
MTRRVVQEALNKPDHIKLPVLIAAHTGARLSEFTVAHTSDIELVEGVWWFADSEGQPAA